MTRGESYLLGDTRVNCPALRAPHLRVLDFAPARDFFGFSLFYKRLDSDLWEFSLLRVSHDLIEISAHYTKLCVLSAAANCHSHDHDLS